MMLLDKLKEQANQVDQSAKEVGKAASAKLDQAEATLRTHGLLHDLGVAVYAARSGPGGSGSSVAIDRLVAKIAQLRGEHVTASKTPASKAPASKVTAHKPKARAPKQV